MPARRDLRQNNISGALPDNWAQPGALPQLGGLNLVGNQLGGSLPAAWGAAGSFLQLVELCARCACPIGSDLICCCLPGAVFPVTRPACPQT